MQIFALLKNIFDDIWFLLFNTPTLFGFSFGTIILGCTVAFILWQVVLLALGVNTSDFSSLGSPRDYYKRSLKNKETYQKAEAKFRASHNGKLVSSISNKYEDRKYEKAAARFRKAHHGKLVEHSKD